MKEFKVVLAFIIVTFLFYSCDHERIRASEEISSLEYAIPAYSQLSVANAFNVFVTFSESEEHIRIEANENIQDRIVVKRDGNTLVIKLKKFTKIQGNATLNAYITTQNITKFDLSGASTIHLENEWLIQNGEIDASGGSDFKGEVDANRLTVDLSGASQTDLYGTANQLHADLSGSSEIRDFDFSVARLRIDLSGASDAFLLVNETIDVEASGASTLNYKGNAEIIREDLSGASELRNSN